MGYNMWEPMLSKAWFQRPSNRRVEFRRMLNSNAISGDATIVDAIMYLLLVAMEMAVFNWYNV